VITASSLRRRMVRERVTSRGAGCEVACPRPREGKPGMGMCDTQARERDTRG
jgi:hypothetical protein